jgi:hypothetical protein
LKRRFIVYFELEKKKERKKKQEEKHEEEEKGKALTSVSK